MQLKINYDRENKDKTIEMGSNASVKELLAKLNINPVTVIVSKNNDVVTEDEKLSEKDDIKIISVISGG